MKRGLTNLCHCNATGGIKRDLELTYAVQYRSTRGRRDVHGGATGE